MSRLDREARVVAEQAALMRRLADDCDCDSFHEGAKALRMGAEMLENIHTEAQRIVAVNEALTAENKRVSASNKTLVAENARLAALVPGLSDSNIRLSMEIVMATNEARVAKSRLVTFLVECDDMRERFNNLMGRDNG